MSSEEEEDFPGEFELHDSDDAMDSDEYESGEEQQEPDDFSSPPRPHSAALRAKFFADCINGDIQAVAECAELKLLVNSRDSHTTTYKNKTPLMYICSQGNLEMARLLLANGAATNFQDARGWTALTYAAKKNQVEMLKVLIDEFKTPVHFPVAPEGMSTIFVAAWYDKLEACQFLHSRGADVSVALPRLGNLMTPATQTKDERMILWLHSLGVNPNISNGVGLYPIHHLAKHGYLHPMKVLVDDVKADIHVKDRDGRTAIDVANEHNMSEVVLFLFEKGLDPTLKKAKSLTFRNVRPWMRDVPQSRDQPAFASYGSKLVLMGGNVAEADFLNHDPENWAHEGGSRVLTDLYTLDLNEIKLEPLMSLADLKPFRKTVMSRKGSHMELSRDGLSGRTTYQPNDEGSQVSTVRASTPFTKKLKCGYFEMTVLNPGEKRVISIGLVDSNYSLDGNEPGWKKDSYGLHGDDGACFHNSGRGTPYCDRFEIGDVVGCGISWEHEIVFFTKNGEFLGVPYRFPRSDEYWPTIGSENPGAEFKVNFGRQPFRFNLHAPALHWKAIPNKISLERHPEGNCRSEFLKLPNEKLLITTEISQIHSINPSDLFDPAVTEIVPQALTERKMDRPEDIERHGMVDLKAVLLGDVLYYCLDDGENTSLIGLPLAKPALHFVLTLDPTKLSTELVPEDKRAFALDAHKAIQFDGDLVAFMVAVGNDRLGFISKGRDKLILVNPKTFEVEVKTVAKVADLLGSGHTVWRDLVCFFGGRTANGDNVNHLEFVDMTTGAVCRSTITGSCVPKTREANSLIAAVVTNPLIVGESDDGKTRTAEVLVSAFGRTPLSFVDEFDILVLENQEKPDELIKLREGLGFFDVTISINGGQRKIPAHKVILYHRCAQLRKLITPEASEIHIGDVHPDMFEVLVSYLYGDVINAQKLEAIGSFRDFAAVVDRFASEHKKHIFESYLLMQTSKASTMSADVGRALTGNMFGDIVFQVEGQKFHLHKAILVARNAYFSAMLTGGLKESGQEVIDLTDIAAGPFRIVLEFIYTKNLDKALESVNEENIVEVFTLACRYDVKKLKGELERLLAYNVTQDNAASFFELAEQMSATILLAHCKTILEQPE